MARRTADEAAATRQRILDVARRQFAERGVHEVSLDGLAAESGVTRGAVHHHFGDKHGLFVEVFALVERELNEAVVQAGVAAARAGGDPLAAGCHALFEFVRRGDYRQIALTDAPGVLGLVEWYRVDREAGLASMRSVVAAAADAGRLAPGRVDAVALVLFGALTEAALAMALDGAGGQSGVTEDDVIETVQAILDGLGPDF